MDQENASLFEQFVESGSTPDSSGLLGQLVVRPARMQDVEALGRISADREGGDAQVQSAAFRRSIEDGGAGHRRLILVAELERDVIGFGKARYLSEEHGAGVGASPEGWYLTGVVVDPRFRRRGVGCRLTGERLRWIAERSDAAYYFANAGNRVSIALHESFGFTEIGRGAEFAGVSFVGGEGVLFEVDLARP